LPLGKEIFLLARRLVWSEYRLDAYPLDATPRTSGAAMTAFVRLKADQRLMCVAERIPAGPVGFLLKGYVEGVRYVTIVPERDTVPEPGAPMPRVRMVGDE
jgi:hypothetical protein